MEMQSWLIYLHYNKWHTCNDCNYHGCVLSSLVFVKNSWQLKVSWQTFTETATSWAPVSFLLWLVETIFIYFFHIVKIAYIKFHSQICSFLINQKESSAYSNQLTRPLKLGFCLFHKELVFWHHLENQI